jgi:hypothetical protein
LRRHLQRHRQQPHHRKKPYSPHLSIIFSPQNYKKPHTAPNKRPNLSILPFASLHYSSLFALLQLEGAFL